MHSIKKLSFTPYFGLILMASLFLAYVGAEQLLLAGWDMTGVHFFDNIIYGTLFSLMLPPSFLITASQIFPILSHFFPILLSDINQWRWIGYLILLLFFLVLGIVLDRIKLRSVTLYFILLKIIFYIYLITFIFMIGLAILFSGSHGF